MQTQFQARLNWLARALSWLSCHANLFIRPCRLLTHSAITNSYVWLLTVPAKLCAAEIRPSRSNTSLPDVLSTKQELASTAIHFIPAHYWYKQMVPFYWMWQRHLNNHIISGLAGLAFKVQWEHLKMRKTNTDEVMGDECWLALLAIPPIIWLSQMNHNARRWKYSHRLQVMARYNSRHLFN